MKTRHSSKELSSQGLPSEVLTPLEMKKRKSKEIIEAKRNSQNLIRESVGGCLLHYLLTVEKSFPGILVYLSTLNDPADKTTNDNPPPQPYSPPQGRLFMKLNINVKINALENAEKSEKECNNIDNTYLDDAIKKQPKILEDIEAYLKKIPPIFTETTINLLLTDRRRLVHDIMPTGWVEQIHACLDPNRELDSKTEKRLSAEEVTKRNKVINFICGAILYHLVANIPTLSSKITKFSTSIWSKPSSTTQTIIEGHAQNLKRNLDAIFQIEMLKDYLKADDKIKIADTLSGFESSLERLDPKTHEDIASLQDKGITILLEHLTLYINDEALSTCDKKHNVEKQLKNMVVAYVKKHFKVIQGSRDNVKLALSLLATCARNIKTKRMIKKLSGKLKAEEAADEAFKKSHSDSVSLLDEEETRSPQFRGSSSSYSKTPVSRTHSLMNMRHRPSNTGGSESESGSTNQSGSSDHSFRQLARRLTEGTLKRPKKPSTESTSPSSQEGHNLVRARRRPRKESADAEYPVTRATSTSKETSPPASPNTPRKRPVRKTDIPDTAEQTLTQTPANFFQPTPEPKLTSPMIFSKKRH